MNSRILVALASCDIPKYTERRNLCESTWGSRMPPGYEFQTFTGHRLGVGDDYASLQKKTKAILQYARAQRYDGMFKVDDDVFLRADRLRVIEQPYAGHILPEGANVDADTTSYCAGGFYWLNRQAIEILADAPFAVPFMDRTSAEDQWVGWTLRQHGIVPHALPEVAMQQCWCGKCVPAPLPTDWMAYMLWMEFRKEQFLELNRCYR
jgi:hypothetical protein